MGYVERGFKILINHKVKVRKGIKCPFLDCMDIVPEACNSCCNRVKIKKKSVICLALKK